MPSITLTIYRIKQALGIGPRITKARSDGVRPWSITVININRMRARRRRLMMRNILIMLMIGACLACNVAFIATQMYGGKAQAANQPAKTPKPKITVTATVPPQPTREELIDFVIVTLTPSPGDSK